MKMSDEPIDDGWAESLGNVVTMQGRPVPGTQPLTIAAASLRPPQAIPPREWLYGVLMLRRYLTVIVAPGGVGKTALAVGIGLSLASGRNLIGDHIHAQANVLFCGLEDPEDEFDRRVAAFMTQQNMDETELYGRVFYVNGRARRLVIASLDRHGSQIVYPDKDPLIAEINTNNIGAVFVDPFVNSHELDENDNPQINAAARAWAEIGEQTGCSIVLVHHTRKGATAGDIDASRGASALVNAARVGLTMTAMTKEEAAQYSINLDERRRYVRLDDGKSNLSPPSDRARWFYLASVNLENGSPQYPNGDSVQAITQWSPPDLFDQHLPATINACLDTIASGFSNGVMFAKTMKGSKDRWVGSVVMGALGCQDGKAKAIIAAWFKSGLLEEVEFRHPETRQMNKGVAVNDDHRPTE